MCVCVCVYIYMDRMSTPKHRTMGLSDGGASDRRLFKLAEDLLDGLAQLLLDDATDLGGRPRRDAVQKGLEHVDVDLWDLKQKHTESE